MAKAPKKAEDKISKKKLEAFVIKLRHKELEFEKQSKYCRDHNFTLEMQVETMKAEVVRRICHEIENEFDLGLCWDSSLNG